MKNSENFTATEKAEFLKKQHEKILTTDTDDLGIMNGSLK